MIIQRMRHWSAAAESGLEQALGTARDRAAIIAGIESGALECWRLWDGAAYMVTRLEPGELTVCCYQGARMDEAAHWLTRRAAELGCAVIRFHTARPALARRLFAFRPRLVEHVYEIAIGEAA